MGSDFLSVHGERSDICPGGWVDVVARKPSYNKKRAFRVSPDAGPGLPALQAHCKPRYYCPHFIDEETKGV